MPGGALGRLSKSVLAEAISSRQTGSGGSATQEGGEGMFHLSASELNDHISP